MPVISSLQAGLKVNSTGNSLNTGEIRLSDANGLFPIYSLSANNIPGPNGNIQTVSLNGNCVFTMPSASAAANLTIIINQTGSFTATFTGAKWTGGVAPTITTGSGKIDIISFISDGTNWYGGIVQNLS